MDFSALTVFVRAARREEMIRDAGFCAQCEQEKPRGDLFCDACHRKYWPVLPPAVADILFRPGNILW